MTSRVLHLIDIENILLTSRPETEQVAAIYSAYAPLVGAGDHVVVACNHGAFPAVGWAWPTARYLLRSGENGADTALLDVIDHENVGARFDEIVLVSGDGIFTEAVAELGATGVKVTVVSHQEALAKRLRLAAGHVVHVNPAVLADARLKESA